MADNRIMLGDEVLLDVSDVTATPDKVALGSTFVDCHGEHQDGAFDMSAFEWFPYGRNKQLVGHEHREWTFNEDSLFTREECSTGTSKTIVNRVTNAMEFVGDFGCKDIVVVHRMRTELVYPEGTNIRPRVLVVENVSIQQFPDGSKSSSSKMSPRWSSVSKTLNNIRYLGTSGVPRTDTTVSYGIYCSNLANAAAPVVFGDEYRIVSALPAISARTNTSYHSAEAMMAMVDALITYDVYVYQVDSLTSPYGVEAAQTIGLNEYEKELLFAMPDFEVGYGERYAPLENAVNELPVGFYAIEADFECTKLPSAYSQNVALSYGFSLTQPSSNNSITWNKVNVGDVNDHHAMFEKTAANKAITFYAPGTSTLKDGRAMVRNLKVYKAG